MEDTTGQTMQPIIHHHGDKADLLEKIRPDEIVEIIRNRLMGKEYIEGRWVIIKSLQERALTEKGAWDISNLMLPASSRNVSVSKLKDEEIRKRVFNLSRQAQEMCLKNWKEYGIKGTDQLGFVHQIIFTNSLITLKQPEGEGIRKMLMGTISESRNVNQIGEVKSGRIKGMFRR